MANTIGTGTYSSVWRAKYATNLLQMSLRKALVAQAICNVDKTDSYYIHSPYISGTTAATVNTSGMTGTYSVSDWTTVEDSLTVTEEISYAVRVKDFEKRLASIDLYTSFLEELTRAVADKIDTWILNEILDHATGTYDTPTGGFTTAANWPKILSVLFAKVSGYRDTLGGFFLVLENSDIAGVVESQMATGFNFADAALKNGLVSQQANVDIYVVRDSTFMDDAAGASGYSGTQTWTNSGHRLFGVKGIATYANPGGIQYRDLEVTGYTGKEVAVWGNFGAKVWYKKTGLFVDITVK